jgi:low affinity Fe/Cu permease
MIALYSGCKNFTLSRYTGSNASSGRPHMNKLFAKFSNAVSRAAGHPVAFMLAVLSVVIWGATGPIFGYSENWQLVINTGTTIVTFLMVFVIQNAQNRDGAAIQAKLDELIRASEGENAFIGIEHLSQEEVEAFRSRCEAAAKRADGAVDRANRKATEAADKTTGTA